MIKERFDLQYLDRRTIDQLIRRDPRDLSTYDLYLRKVVGDVFAHVRENMGLICITCISMVHGPMKQQPVREYGPNDVHGIVIVTPRADRAEWEARTLYVGHNEVCEECHKKHWPNWRPAIRAALFTHNAYALDTWADDETFGGRD